MSIDHIQGGKPKRFEKLLTKADTNGDKSLSKEELAAVKNKKGESVFSAERLDKLFGRVDKDNNGLINQDEFLANRGKHLAKGHHKHQAPPTADQNPLARLEAFIKRLDANGDGAISAEEIQAFKDQVKAQEDAAAPAPAPAADATTESVNVSA